MPILPTILLIPGLWVGPTVYDPVRTLLHGHGYETHTRTLPSTGSLSPGNPSMKDDIASIRSTIRSLLSPKPSPEILLVLHSAAGFLGSEAMQGLSVTQRKERGEEGGVTGIVFLCGGIAPVGHLHTTLPFFDFVNAPKGGMTCLNARHTLFSDFSDEEAEPWLKVLRPQPAEGWDGVTEYCGWLDVRTVYLVGEGDRVLPREVQEGMAGLTGGRVERCAAGHMVMLRDPGRCVEVIKGLVEDLEIEGKGK